MTEEEKKEYHRAKAKAYYWAHKEKVKAYVKDWCNENKGKCKNYYSSNKVEYFLSNYSTDITKVENYELALQDNFVGWHVHHRLETHTSDGERRPVSISLTELKALGMYYNRPPEELVFMKVSEHVRLHRSKAA